MTACVTPITALVVAGIPGDGIPGRGEHPAQSRSQEFQRLAFHCRVERGIIVDLAKAGRAFAMQIPAKLFTHVRIQADVPEEIVALEDAVFLDHPMTGCGDEGFD